MKKTIFLVCLLPLLSSILKARLSPSQIDSLVQKALAKFKVAGAAVAVVERGKVIYAKGHGVTAVIGGKPVNEFTNFQIASNSKAFTTTALSILEEEGKLKWTDKVVAYLPEFTMYNEYVANHFTIQDLLTHRSGLGLGAGDLMFFPDGADFTIQDVLKNFQYLKPTSEFRMKFDYDNLLYLVAGELIARVSKMSYEDFIQQKILTPLQMTHTYPSGKKTTDTTNRALPHYVEKDTLKVGPLYAGMINSAAGGIYSNVADLAKWMMVHLNKGKYGDSLKTRLFSVKNQNEMWNLHTVFPSYPEPRYNIYFSGYGLGWYLYNMKGKLAVMHTGGLPGMISSVTMLPDLKVGIVILTNTDPGGGDFQSALEGTFIDSYLGLDDLNRIETISTYGAENKHYADSIVNKVWQTVEIQKNAKVKWENYIGIYEDKWFGKTEVFKKGNQLWFKSYRSPKLNGPMYFYNANTFAIKFQYQIMNCDAFASFHLDETGKAQLLKLKGISPNIDFSFDFQDLDLNRISR